MVLVKAKTIEKKPNTVQKTLAGSSNADTLTRKLFTNLSNSSKDGVGNLKKKKKTNKAEQSRALQQQDIIQFSKCELN